MIERAGKIPQSKLTEADARLILRAIDQYNAEDPVRFAVKQLGIRPWSKQAEVMRAVQEHRRVAVRSGHKVGKSNLAAVMSLWWVRHYKQGRVVLTAPTGRQVRDVLWKEIRRLHRKAKYRIGGRLARSPSTGLQYDDGREIVGLSTDEPERIAGYSGPEVLIVVDEASGVEEDIFEAIEGNRAGGAHLLLLGNPTQTTGTFFNAFQKGTSKRSSEQSRWMTFHVSSLDSPNITGEMHVSGLAIKEWCDEKLEDWGADSPLYQIRVLGDFPEQSESAVIGMKLVETGIEAWGCEPPGGIPPRLNLGVDVARFGDDETSICSVRGRRVLRFDVVSKLDTVQVANRVRAVARELRLDDQERPLVKIDSIGIGAGVVDQCRAWEDEMDICAVNVAEKATVEDDGVGYERLRDQLWFTMRDWLKDGGAIPDDSKLREELLAPRYSFTVLGKLKVDGKDEIKKRIKRSPDRADSLAMAVYQAPRTLMETWLGA